MTLPRHIPAFIVRRIAEDSQTNLRKRISLTAVLRGVAPFAMIVLAVLVVLILPPGLEPD